VIKYRIIMRIGIFDSGIGGEAVAIKLQKLLPLAEIMSVNDHEHMPYGALPQQEVINLTLRAIKPLLDKECDAIIIACNTATTVAISSLRQSCPSTNFIGIEPMVKPAALATKTGVIAVCATPNTLKSDRYKELKQTWTDKITVIEPDCDDWAEMIERGMSDTIDVESTMERLINLDVDVIVLGCTHYHWLKSRIAAAVGSKVIVLEPSDAIAERIKSLID